jgi:hypothetical protein
MINNLIEINEKEIFKNIKQNKKYKKKNFNLKGIDKEFNFKINNFYKKEELDGLLKEILKYKWKQIDINGYTKFDNKYNKEYKGSKRLTFYSEDLSDLIWGELKNIIPKYRIFDKENIDVEKNSIWKPIGINPLFRLMKYKKGSILVPHYDAPYIQSEKEKTLTTIVLYLTTNKSGATRFLKDNRKEHNYKDNNEIKINDNDILIKELPEIGKIIVFDHRLYHDSELLIEDENKIILRTDILYEKEGKNV